MALRFPADRMPAARVAPDWAALAADPRFVALERRKGRFVLFLLTLAVCGYLLLPIGAAFYPGLFAYRLYGYVNCGILFALGEFVLAWGIALAYMRRSNRDFDRVVAELNAELLAGRADVAGGGREC